MSTELPLRVAIAVQGRFHAFDLAKALARQPGVEISLLTNYSRQECAAFQFPAICRLAHFPAHRWLQAGIFRLLRAPLPRWVDAWLHESFGRWAANRMAEMIPLPNVLRIFSGVALESLRHSALAPALRIVTRGSSHIIAQGQILQEEERRARVRLDRPSLYMQERELAEYTEADTVLVLSTFARDTFLAAGCQPERIWLAPNAVNLDWYGATPQTIAERRQRILGGGPLRVLTVGSFSYRKGIIDLAKVIRRLHSRFQFRFVGDLPAEGMPLRRGLNGLLEFRNRVPPQVLRDEYAWGDVFLFPTIEDGFPASLSQALAAGLPAITTPHGSGPDLIHEGRNGWLVPIRAAEDISQRLEFLDQNRQVLADCGITAAGSIAARSWNDVAADFVIGARKRLMAKTAQTARIS